MTRTARVLLVLRALGLMARYDLVNAVFGFQGIHRLLERRRVAPAIYADSTPSICDAVALAACFYYKPVLCLQRSFVAALLLRERGIDARFVIGYRPAPFFSHAWVEVDGQVVNDSPGYKAQLQVLCTA